jgi:hypothetical protein
MPHASESGRHRGLPGRTSRHRAVDSPSPCRDGPSKARQSFRATTPARSCGLRRGGEKRGVLLSFFHGVGFVLHTMDSQRPQWSTLPGAVTQSVSRIRRQPRLPGGSVRGQWIHDPASAHRPSGRRCVPWVSGLPRGGSDQRRGVTRVESFTAASSRFRTSERGTPPAYATRTGHGAGSLHPAHGLGRTCRHAGVTGYFTCSACLRREPNTLPLAASQGHRAQRLAGPSARAREGGRERRGAALAVSAGE